ncbi:MAG TPA: hypothetical protein VFN35_31240, partial [Ktedonobacteraceae bacterium]|nr:hypothetical protein [Ktedonobacteraceae bacterium]
YTLIPGKSSTHCFPCFSCHHYKPLIRMYGRVGERGYCCHQCEAQHRWSNRLIFTVVLNLPTFPPNSL